MAQQQMYQYRAWDRTGNLVTGTIETDSPDSVANRLRVQGYFLSSLEPVKAKSSLFQRKPKRVKAKDLALFCRQFGIMVETGMPIVVCLKTLAEQSEGHFRAALEGARRQVSGGEGLTESLRAFGNILPNLFLDMVEMGEMSGNLGEVLDQLAIYYEKEDRINKEVKQAMQYPTFVGSFAFLMLFVVIFFVLPMFSGIYAEYGVQLPFVTRMVLAGRDWAVRNALYIVVGFVLFVVGFRRYSRTTKGRLRIDGVMLRLPIVGKLVSQIIFSRFSRSMSLLVKSGVSMLEALNISERIVGNKAVAQDVMRARAGVEKGEGISGPLREGKTFPNMLIEMISVGEETGGLDSVLIQVSDFYDNEVEHGVKSLTSLLEPIIMVFLAGMVTLIAVSIITPMFNMMNVIQ